MNLTIVSTSLGSVISFFVTDICLRLTQTIVHFAWQGCVIAALYTLVEFGFRRRSANVRYVVAVTSLGAMMIVPLLTIVLVSLSPLDTGTNSSSSREPTSAELPHLRIRGTASQLSPYRPDIDLARMDETAGSCQTSSTWIEATASYATIAYVTGVFAMLLRLARGLNTIRRLRQQSSVADSELLRIIQCAVDKLAMRSIPAIMYCQQVTIPVVVGILRPIILLPPSLMTGLSHEQLETILIHELAHIRRADHWINLAQRIAESFLFFHPAVWYVSQRVSVERENACDDLVVATGHQTRNYVEALLNVAEFCALQQNIKLNLSTLLAASGTDPSQLKQRVLRLLGEPISPVPRMTRAGTGSVIIASLMLFTASIVLAAGRAKQLVHTGVRPYGVKTIHACETGDIQEISRRSVVENSGTSEPMDHTDLPTTLSGPLEDVRQANNPDLKVANPNNETSHHLMLIDVTDAPTSESPAGSTDRNNSPILLDAPLVAVVVEGNSSISGAEILKHIKTRTGQQATSWQIKNDVDALVRTRWFASVEPFLRQTDEGTVLVFCVLERPFVHRIEYKGLRKVKQKVLDTLTQLKAGSPFDVSANRECCRRIEEYYHEKGFAFATVNLEKGNDRNDREVVFLIHEGPKVHVTAVKFDGDNEFIDGILKTKTRTKTRTLWLFGGEYDPSTVRDGIEGIKHYYHGLGYFDVKIQEKLTSSDNKATVEFHYEVDEGVRYKIRNIEIVGNNVLSEDQIRDMMKVEEGTFYNAQDLHKDVDTVKSIYGEQGRLFSCVDAVPRFTEEPGIVDIIYRIMEDKIYRIRNIEVHIKGDRPKNKMNPVPNISPIQPGDLADPKKLL
jgi:beta-lactamase regulating signal transducer with metallopeptidase domain